MVEKKIDLSWKWQENRKEKWESKDKADGDIT